MLSGGAQQQEVGGPKLSVQEVGPFLLNKTHQSEPDQSETLMLETVSQLCSRMLFIVGENDSDPGRQSALNLRAQTFPAHLTQFLAFLQHHLWEAV